MNRILNPEVFERQQTQARIELKNIRILQNIEKTAAQNFIPKFSLAHLEKQQTFINDLQKTKFDLEKKSNELNKTVQTWTQFQNTQNLNASVKTVIDKEKETWDKINLEMKTYIEEKTNEINQLTTGYNNLKKQYEELQNKQIQIDQKINIAIQQKAPKRVLKTLNEIKQNHY